MRQWNRRGFIKASGLGAVGMLSGCCSVSLNSRQALEASPALSSFLATENRALSGMPYQKAIDAHSHFFNATDIQAGGYLAGPMAAEAGANSKLMEYIGSVIDELARRIAPSASQEYRYLEGLNTRVFGKNRADIKSEIEKDILDQNSIIAEELFAELKKTGFQEEFDKQSLELQSRSRRFKLSAELIRDVLNNFSEVDLEAKKLGGAQADKSRVAMSIFVFIGHMLSYRTHSIHAYEKAYSEKPAKVKVVCAANAMVDFDRWVGHCDQSYSPLVDQIELNDRLASVHGNYIFNLVSFNPWTAIIEGKGYYDLIEQTLGRESFKGVKIYPPIGYYPANNGAPDKPTRTTKHPDLGELDDSLELLYEICSDMGVPVMAHGNHSMGTRPDYRAMAGPAEWGNVLDCNKDLKVNIGHFGGESDVKGKNWTMEFLNLMKQHENLAADIGYWDELYKQNNANAFACDRLDFDLTNSKKADSRIMYGSDWFMNSKDLGWEQYLSRTYANLDNAGVETEPLNRLYFENAESFFKLKDYIRI